MNEKVGEVALHFAICYANLNVLQSELQICGKFIQFLKERCMIQGPFLLGCHMWQSRSDYELNFSVFFSVPGKVFPVTTLLGSVFVPRVLVGFRG